jgi:hypothetical protein
MIYFLRRADGAIKIGTTEKCYARRSDLAKQHGNLELLGVMEGGREEEQALHNKFSHARLKGSHKTEWFNSCQELLDYITMNTSLEVHSARDVTIKLSDKTHLLLKSFQNGHFARTGQRLTNDAAITLAIQLADPLVVQWVEEFLAKQDNVALSPTKTYDRTF